MSRKFYLLLLPALLAACATVIAPQLDALYGKADPTKFDTPSPPAAGESYARTIQPLLNQRCVVCHACYDAACQLKATSWDALARGASKTPVYDASRLLAAEPTRLYVDAQKPSEWRDRGFYPVLNERTSTPENNRTLSLLYRMLELKEQHPWPTDPKAQASLDLAPDHALMCPRIEEMDGYARAKPLGGMPYGLPGLSKQEQQQISRWLAQGAPYEGPEPTPAAVRREADQWEQFFNGDSLKEQLFARYAYEHLFLAHLYFEDDGERHYFKLIRSSTPPGQPTQVIATARPVDDPGVARVYYRLEPERETIVAKTHMPYRLNAARMARWRELFLQPSYTVERLPGYTADTAANPFATFAALPVGARYRFMLEEAEFTIMGFIKGPVCRGQIALNVIEDQFWVSFVAPSPAYDQAIDKLLQKASESAALPTGRSSSDAVFTWLQYNFKESAYRRERSAYLNAALKGRERLNLNLLWDGDGHNDNAGLTIFRHFDSATVVKGFVGDTPKTAWVIDYPLLERIHYLLVANYDVYGNVGHQLNSRLYMDYLRMEGEFNFISFLPKSARIPTRDFWYRGVGKSEREQVYGGADTTLQVDSNISYQSADPRSELMDLIKARLSPVLDQHYDWRRHSTPALQAQLQPLAELRGSALQWMPELTVLVVDLPDGSSRNFSLLRNTAHASVSHLLGEHLELLPEENTLSLVPGVLGSYPNALYHAKAAELPQLAADLSRLKSAADYTALTHRWAIRRDTPHFWSFSDALMQRYAREQPLEAGVLDYNRLENR